MQGRPRQFSKPDALNAAIDVFWRQGFASASMADLLARMNINRQSAYDTFGDKRDLFLQALHQYNDTNKTTFLALFAQHPSPLARIRAFLQLLAQRTACNDGRGCLLTNAIVELAPHDPEIRAITSTILHTLQQLLATTLQEAIAKRELPPTTDPLRLARLLVTVMQGSLVLAKTNLAAGVQDALTLLDTLALPPHPNPKAAPDPIHSVNPIT